jgi:Uma2 family endonuclease
VAQDICNKFVMGAEKLNLPHYTYDDYCQWEGRWELIHGIPFAMSPLPVPAHQRLGGRLFAIFDEILSTQCEACVAYPPIDWKVEEDTVLQPDLLVVCRAVDKKFLDFPPSLIVEILLPSSVLKDGNDKFTIYEEQGVKYYLIIDVALKKIEVFELVNGKYELVTTSPSSFAFTFHDDCKITVPFDELWD